MKNATGHFPGGPVVRNPAVSTGDTGSIPGLGGSHMLLDNESCAPQLELEVESLQAATTGAHEPRACAL